MTWRRRAAPASERWSRPGRAPPLESLSLAVLLVHPVADLALLEEPVLEEQLVVGLRDPDRRQEDRRNVADLVVRCAVHTGHLLTLDDLDCCLRSGGRLLLHGLVDRAALPAGEDVLDAGR